MIKYIKQDEFEKEIAVNRVLVDFYASWCGPCKMIGLVLEKFDDENIIPILKLDIDEATKLVEEYKIFSVPTLIIFENGKEIKRITGFMSKEEIESWVNS